MELGEVFKENNRKNMFEASEIKTENLTFMDGVLVTWNVFNKVLNKRLKNEKGIDEKDDFGYSYLQIINDDITDLLLSEILDNSYFKIHGNNLNNLFTNSIIQ